MNFPREVEGDTSKEELGNTEEVERDTEKEEVDAESSSSTTSSFGSLPSLRIRGNDSTIADSTADSAKSITSSLGSVPSLLLNWEDASSADESLEILLLSLQSQETPTTTTRDMTAIQPDTDGESIMGDSGRSSESKVDSLVE